MQCAGCFLLMNGTQGGGAGPQLGVGGVTGHVAPAGDCHALLRGHAVAGGQGHHGPHRLCRIVHRSAQEGVHRGVAGHDRDVDTHIFAQGIAGVAWRGGTQHRSNKAVGKILEKAVWALIALVALMMLVLYRQFSMLNAELDSLEHMQSRMLSMMSASGAAAAHTAL